MPQHGSLPDSSADTSWQDRGQCKTKNKCAHIRTGIQASGPWPRGLDRDSLPELPLFRAVLHYSITCFLIFQPLTG